MPDDRFLDSVIKGAERANINLHLVTPITDGRVDTDLITRVVPEWKKADVWFCGPARFGESIKIDILILYTGLGRYFLTAGMAGYSRLRPDCSFLSRCLERLL